MTMSYYSYDELKNLGFKSLGHNIKLSKKSSIYGAEHIEIESNTRIDDFTILSASNKGIHIGRNVHIAAYSGLFGAEKITILDFANISSRVSIYSSSDDYSGETLTNPTIPEKFKSVDSRPVVIGQHVIVGCGSVILPGVELESGCSVGSLSLVKKSFTSCSVVAGVPAKCIARRSDRFIQLQNKYEQENASSDRT